MPRTQVTVLSRAQGKGAECDFKVEQMRLSDS